MIIMIIIGLPCGQVMPDSCECSSVWVGCPEMGNWANHVDEGGVDDDGEDDGDYGDKDNEDDGKPGGSLPVSEDLIIRAFWGRLLFNLFNTGNVRLITRKA